MSRKSEESNIADCLDWQDADFRCLRLRLQRQRRDNLQAELTTRHENIEMLSQVLKECSIPFWIHGKTLLGIVRDKQLITEDHDDDIGVFAEHRTDVCARAYPRLREHGFQAIRCNDAMLSVIRDDRYIDICFFKQKKGKIGYGKKWFPKEYFKAFDSVIFHQRQYPIPCQTEELLTLMYPSTAPNQGKTLADRLYRPIKKIKRKIKKTRKWIKESLLKKDVIRQISQAEFLALKLEADNAVNWTLRAPHLNIITDKGRTTQIADIIAFLKDADRLQTIKETAIIETDMTEVFAEPVNFNHKLWKSRNNFLFYCIYYGFRRDVVAYDQMNAYIATTRDPMLYSAAYFESLDEMDDTEIRTFLKDNPIILGKSAVAHGKHRACAMIGRLIRGQTYVPLYVKEKVNRF